MQPPPTPPHNAKLQSRQTLSRLATHRAATGFISPIRNPPACNAHACRCRAAHFIHTADMIRGSTRLIAHIGVPTHGFRSPMIYNPYFEQAGIDAIVVPMGCEAAHYPALLRSLFKLTNICGALVTMPHKVTTVALLDEASPAVQIAGACNAVRRTDHGRLAGDMFDGEGFVRGMRRKGCDPAGKRALIVGSGGVGSAIAAAYGRRARGRAEPVRYLTRLGAGIGRAPADPLPFSFGPLRFEPPRRSRYRGQCHAAWHERRRSAAA